MTFNTYYWHRSELGDPELDNARAVLASPTDAASCEHAFLMLLRSGTTAAIGTALDHYDYAEAFGRHGFGNLFAAHSQEVLDRARDLLRQPPLRGDDEDGVNHASALGVMLNLAQAEDAELIAAVLEEATGVGARDAALSAARRALDRAAVPNPRLVNILSEIVFDDARPTSERTSALTAVGDVAVDVVLRAIELDDLHLQGHAAWVLAYRDLDRYRALLERVVATWPDDPPYPGSEAFELLRENP